MNGLFVDLGLRVLSILWGVFCPHQTCKFQSEAERVKQSQLAIACPQACFLNYWIQNHVPRDALSCKCLESHSHIMRLTYSMYSSMAVSGCTMHCHASRRPYLQCLYPKHVLNLPGMIANSKQEDEVSVEAVNWTRSSAAIAGTNQGQTDLTSGNAGCQMLPELLLEHCLGRQLQRQSQRGGWCPACSETPGHPRRGCRRGRPRLWGFPGPTSRLSPHQHSTCQEVADKLLSEFMFHSGRQDSHVLFEACPIFTCILFEICPMFSYETNSQQPALL